MNPELQAQLLEILKSLKDGASPVFDELVRQKQLYYLVNIITLLTVSITSAITAKVVFYKGVKNNSNINEDVFIMYMVLLVASITVSMITGIIVLTQIPEYFAPLGYVLGQVIK